MGKRRGSGAKLAMPAAPGATPGSEWENAARGLARARTTFQGTLQSALGGLYDRLKEAADAWIGYEVSQGDNVSHVDGSKPLRMASEALIANAPQPRWDALESNAAVGRRADMAADMLSVIHYAPPGLAPTLHRGISLSDSPEDVLRRVRVGMPIETGLTSFSERPGAARSFSRSQVEKTRVLFELEPGSRAMRMEPFDTERSRFMIGAKRSEQEWVSAGRFEVTSATRSGDTVRIGLRQTATYNPDTFSWSDGGAPHPLQNSRLSGEGG